MAASAKRPEVAYDRPETRCAAEPEEKKESGHNHVPGEEEGHEAPREDQTAPPALFFQNSRDGL